MIGRDVAVIVILRASPKIKGISPIEIASAHERAKLNFSHVSPNVKITTLPRINIGNDVRNLRSAFFSARYPMTIVATNIPIK
jgi:hypothetical protein